MCGIVGCWQKDDLPMNSVLIGKMRDTMICRGPDDAGLWIKDSIGLGHRRLSIIDLSSAAHQPMVSECGRFVITFNGEVYNFQEIRKDLENLGYRFRSNSDTEVTLEAYLAWGTDCLAKLNGMFAFCIYDDTRKRLFLARDRAGEKPLYYHYGKNGLAFASELKALMADPALPRVLDLNAFNFYLAYGYVPGEMCILKDVRKLGPGQALTYEIRKGRMQSWQYWHLPEPVADQHTSVKELSDELESLLEIAVRRQLVADVPVGILLSGGIDSSLITAMAARASSKPIRTFTISFPGHAKLDEGPYARLVADYFGTQHTELAAEPASVELLPQIAKQYDEPLGDHAIVPTYLISKLIRQDATVALGGDGGDELFGGYTHYSWIQRLERLRPLIPGFIRKSSAHIAERFLPIGTRGRNHIIGYANNTRSSIAHVNLYFDRWSRDQLLSPDMRHFISQSNPELYRKSLCMSGHSPLQQAMEADFKSTLVDAYLVKVDRASMLSSLEVRVPFLDYRIIEFAFGRVPDSLKATGKERKILTRNLASRLLPPGLDLKRKQGFTMPLQAWFKGEWGAFMESVLSEADTSLFDRGFIQQLIAGQRRGYSNINRLFALTMFEFWRKEYKITLPN